MKMFIISYQTVTGRIWDSERYAETARAALASFISDANRMTHPVTVLGVSDADTLDGRTGVSLRIVA